MKTEQLIQAMAADTTRPRPVEQILPLALGAAAILAGMLFYSGLGMRSDLAAALGEPRVIAKHILPIVLAMAAIGASCRFARPGCTAGAWSLALLVAPILAFAAFVAALLSTPAAAWIPTILTSNTAVCLTMIPLLGLAILAASILALRRGASVDPARTGMIAGLLSGGVATALYAFYCIEDSPLFWALWYTTAIALVALAGRWAGHRFLRW